MCTFGKKPFDKIRAKDLLEYLESGVRLPQPETASLDFYLVLLQCECNTFIMLCFYSKFNCISFR